MVTVSVVVVRTEWSELSAFEAVVPVRQGVITGLYAVIR